jgi:hypothetical protein
MIPLPMFLSARPHSLTLGFFALWLWSLDASRESRWAALSLPILAALWANIHASAPLGVLAGALLLVLEKFAFHRTPTRRQVLSLAASAGAVCLNPWGLEVWRYMVVASSHPEITNTVSEWMSPNFHTALSWPILGMVAVLVFLWKRTDRSFKYLSFGMFLAGLVSMRHLSLFLITWPVAVTPACSSFFREPGQKVVLAGTIALTAACLVFASPFFPPAWVDRPQEEDPFPVQAVAYMKEHGLTNRVFNFYTWGGYLIWEGIKPFIDGRADMYVFSGSKVFDDYKRAAFPQNPDPDGVFARWEVKVVLVPENSWLALYLRHHPEWRETYSDETAVVFLKRSEGASVNLSGSDVLY